MNSNTGPETLFRQLERARFERAMGVAESLAAHRALLTTTEITRLNNILTGKNEAPWRQEPVTLTLPSGNQVTFSLIDNPLLITRDKLHRATELAEAGHIVDAAVGIYVDLVLAHVFNDANRRTAVLAAHYFLQRYGVPLSGIALHELGLGDLREEGQIQALKETVRQMAKFVGRKKP